MNPILIVLPILAVLMFDLGLTLRVADFALALKRPRAALVALFGQIVLLPALAWALAAGFGLPPLIVIGVVLIACCPGGSSSNVFSRLAGGDVALSVMLTAVSSVITLFTLPLVMGWVTAAVGASAGISLPVGNLIKQNLVLMLLPVLIGMAVNYFFPDFARRADKALAKTVFPALLVLVSVFYIQHRATIRDNLGAVAVCVTALILLAACCAGLLSRLFRLAGSARRTVVIEVGMQNAAQAIAVASSPFIFNNDTIAIPAILYSMMMNVVLLLYVVLVRRGNRAVCAAA